MRVILQAIRVIDYENNKILTRDIMPKFGEYIEHLIAHVNANVSVREYRTQSRDTEVIGSILKIVEERAAEQAVLWHIDVIANRLLRKECEAQRKVANMDIKVQKGSLLLALLEENGKFKFLLAKVEHMDFFDDADYSIKSGFSKDRRKIWKTCLLEIDDVKSEQYIAKVYSNTLAKYWWHDFLELEEIQSDEKNTKTAFKAIENILNRSLKNDAPYDHMVIRNSIYLYFSSVDQFDFSEMVEKTVKQYTPTDMKGEKKEELINMLNDLPKDKHFDHQFQPVVSVIKPKMQKTYDVYSGIQLKVASAIEGLSDVIKACEDSNGKRYLKIRIDDETTFRTFQRVEVNS